jgi:hypothetical protein
MILAMLCINWQRCYHPLQMPIRLTPVVDSVHIWTCYTIVNSLWSGVTTMERQKFERRCAIKLCVKPGISATVPYEKLQRAYGEHSLSRAQALLRRPRANGRQTLCGKAFNLRNWQRMISSEISLNRSTVHQWILAERSIPVVPQPPYPQTLSPYDFFVFPWLKNHLKVCHFGTSDKAGRAQPTSWNVFQQKTSSTATDNWNNCVCHCHCVTAQGNNFERDNVVL